MNVGKARLAQTFRFLKELNELRNPVPREISGYAKVLWIDKWPAHPLIEVRRGDREEEDDGDVEAQLEPVIRIRRAKLTPCPRPPEALDGWLKPGWQFVETEVEVLKSRNFLDKEKGSITVAFQDDERRVTGLNVWAVARTKWAAAERPAVAARKLFEEIHALWTAMQREGDRTELVLGDGILDVPEHDIQHPVLLQRVSLGFDPAGPEFRFDTGTEKVELHRALLRLVPSVEGRMIAQFDKELEATPVEPLGGESTTGFLRRLVQGLFATDGEFLDGERRDAFSSRPSIRRMPVIFLRARSAGLATTLDHIVEDLENKDTEPPEGLARIVGVESSEPTAASSGTSDGEGVRTPSGPEPDILFSKLANAEQYEIAARLAKSKAVLVQGPPGTGKTHTIANLLGYLLAQGKTVLVTAHTTKALRVLRDQVDDALKPLCLSVLDSDAESHDQLKLAAQEIASKLSTSDAGSLRRDAALLRQKRSKLLDVQAALRRQLRDARFSEVEEVVIGGEALSPIEVAKRVKADAERDAWIPGPLQPGVLCPLTDMEVRQLYASNGTLTPWDEAQLSVPQPALAYLVVPADFRLLAAEKAGADSRARAHRPELWAGNAGRNLTAGELQQLHQRVKAAATVLGEASLWLREVLFAGWSGGGLAETWRDLLVAVDALVFEAGTAQRLIAAHGPELPEGRPVSEVAAMLGQIVDYLGRGGSLGLKTKVTKRSWHALLESCGVDVWASQAPDKIRALQARAQLEVNRSRLADRWRRLVECHDGPAFDTFGRSPERAAQGYAQEIRARLEWRATVWEPLIGELRSTGFRWEEWLAAHPPVPGDHGELTRVERAGSQGLAEVVEAQAALMRQAELSAALSQQRTYLAGFPQSETASVLLQAQDEWNTEMYEEASRQLARLEGLGDAYQTRLAQLARIESAAPAWAHAVSQRHGGHGTTQPLGDPAAAWRWRQWREELERRASVSMTDLQERLSATEDELRNLAAQIIEHETWAAQRERTDLHSRQALMGYVQTIRRVGKGTGKRVPEFLRQARQLLGSARRAVPVWVMPLNRVYESFDPRETRFGVVIIDEASQSDVTALAALYFGREHVVVGDKEQVTPDAVGQRLDQVQRLIDTNLQGIPNSHLYDGQTSIYHLAETAFGGVVALREHFRCVPEIIQFSNDLSYNLTIRPLREPMSASVRPALIAQRVQGFRDPGGKINEVEAEEIASLVVTCLSDPAYALNESGQPTTFGVISLLGIEQALLIEEMLRQRLSPSTFAKHRLLCGNAAQFQGDERDVVFLSMVDGPPDDGQLDLRDAGSRDLYKKRYNVAVSRARNQLWVVHSLDPSAHLKPRDLRRRLIEHARDPQALLRAMEVQGKRTESPFERLVLQRLLATGYRVQTQWPVGAYRIDLVVEGRTGRLAVECDGEKYHTPEQLQRDLDRQGVLERLGWKFVRIRGSVFFRDPDAALAPVFAKLDQLGIEPVGEGIAPPDPSGVVERIRRQAESLRAQWQREKEDAAVAEEDSTTHRKAGTPIPKASNATRAKLPGTSKSPPSLQEKGRASADDQESGGHSSREVQDRLPGLGSSNVTESAANEDRKPIVQLPLAHSNRVLDTLRDLDPRFRDVRCSHCDHTAHLAITNEGIVVTCKECKKSERVDADTLQRLADRLAATCFSCGSGKLKSEARPFGNILKCQNPGCPNNTWQGVSDRIRS
jgi:very-short-patch-repair endonuclease